MSTRAAGILLATDGGKVLLMRRMPGRDHGGEWATPGGHIEEGESPEQAARREFAEETGSELSGPLRPWTRRIKDGVDFTTFLAQAEQFDPKLNEEHDLAKWVTLDEALASPPTEVILHPGVAIALRKLGGMDELEIARAIRDGELASPQRFHNLLLIALRVTGTGASYRLALNEYVWRDPKLYLNDHFLARCNGLEIVWKHPPEKAMLDSKEFRDRIVGSSFLPYIKGDEVWTIARIRDSDAATLLENVDLSTSPGVVFTQSDGNRKVSFHDTDLLIEGKPSLIDHLAITEGFGVWDKGGPKAGIESSDTAVTLDVEGEPIPMADEKEPGAIFSTLDGLLAKCDAFEQSRKDGPFQEMVEKLEKREGYSKEVATKTAAKIGREKLGQAEMTRRSVAARH